MTGLDARRGGATWDGPGRRTPAPRDHDTEPMGAVPPWVREPRRPGPRAPGGPPGRGASGGPTGPGAPPGPPVPSGVAGPVRVIGPVPGDQAGPGGPPERTGPSSGGGSGHGRGRGPLLALAALAAVALVGGVLLYRSVFGAPDYDGPGQGDVIVQVQDGDTTSAIAGELLRADVVRSTRAFTRAAADDESRARSVQPGYYRLRLHMSGANAVALLLDPTARVGQLEIKGGVQLDDTRGPEGSLAPGALSLIARATCTQLNGTSTCVSADQLRRTMATTPPERLGVPSWALGEVTRADPARRLEGLIAPGRYDVRPGSSATEVLRTLVSRSAAQYEALGVTATGGRSGYSPYQLLVIASLVEKEGVTADFGRIAQVLYNRLGDRVRLELDSTVNYPLDLQAVRTSDADRTRPGLYNSYRNYGLPPTPIGAPGQKAVQAALRPTPGPWMFFVRCRKDGISCFATTLPEHQANVRTAMAAGAF